jgi:hypothetical protein
MREYKIKRGHYADLDSLVSNYFGAKGNIEKGIKFEVEGIGIIDMKLEKRSLFVDIKPPKKISGDYSIIKKWNNFLFEATGKNTKERKKDFSKIKN